MGSIEMSRSGDSGWIAGGRITALQWSVIKTPPYKIYTYPLYRVSFPYPANWRKVTEERYEGTDGFFQISAISSEGQIDEVCRTEAFHPLRPYGSTPRIVMTHIHYQEACFIFPSDDQPMELRNQAALIVMYPRPVLIQGTFYNYFILWADHQHIVPLARGLTFI
ncbi:peptidase M56 [Paenibacillus alkaliterrae]|uniref:peptidase M56 n=1 Tax=Paenibacillus alkaliterrae TaxID=320909 RepID=UPI001F427886|nr:peptidase M56 [Paenibacillus alkaliterrae]MCF2937733.1 peptidase M56 [Paenibacillus alkaliterrae]